MLGRRQGRQEREQRRWARFAARGIGGAAALGILFSNPHPAHSFAGEDFLEGNPWHHEAISEDALHAKGFGEPAVQEIAWDADYVDSYLYNPLWWLQGGLSRFKVSLATTPDLIKVHFDDNFSGDQVRRTWRRYLTGCMAGLVWAAEKNDIAAGRNILGVTLHAIQDFYSHSNWIDAPERRGETWFEYDKPKRDLLAVYAGAYEHAPQTGIKSHGKITPACSVLKIDLLKPFLEPGCSAYSPLHNSRLCELYDECKTGSPIQPSLFGQPVPNNVLYAGPPGMNLDARWSANIGVRVRGLSDIDGPKAFDTARSLAQKASEQWLAIAEEKLEKMGFGAYVRQLKAAPDTTMKERQYEEYHRFPYQFISAGPYPPDVGTPEEEWYLRVQTRTGTERGSGTDSDIFLEAAGKRFLLDYTPRANPILGYNDFESGDVGVYTVGPFASLPDRITLFNNSAGAVEINRAIAQSAIDSLKGLVDMVGDSLLSLVAGHADKIGTNRMLWTPEQLEAIPAAGRVFGIQVNGGDEGSYRIDGKITKTAQSPAGAAEGWHEFRIQLTSLYCIREGNIDRLSPSEEPYLLALAVPFPGNIMKYKTAPFPNTDAGETKPIRYTFPTVRVPKAHGMLSLPISLWESDSESEASRRAQLDKFADEASRKTQLARQSVLDAVGAATAADWRLASLTVYAFNRGAHALRTGTVFDRSVNEWIAGKERKIYALNAVGLKSYPDVDARTIDVLPKVPKSPIGYGYDFTGPWRMQFSGDIIGYTPFRMQVPIRMESRGDRVEAFYDGEPMELGRIRFEKGRIFEGEVVEILYNDTYLYRLKGIWSIGTTPAFLLNYDGPKVLQAEFETALEVPRAKGLFLGIGRATQITVRRKGDAADIRPIVGITLMTVPSTEIGPAIMERSKADFNGKWGYGTSHGGDYYRVEHGGGRLKIVTERLDPNHRENKAGDLIFEGTIEPHPQNPNVWNLTGKATARPFDNDTTPAKVYDTTGTVTIRKRRADGAVEHVISLVHRYTDNSPLGEWTIHRAVRQ